MPTPRRDGGITEMRESRGMERDVRALVLGGGGSRGAYQVGALIHLLGERQIPYDIICGVSVGAINAAFLAQYPYGQERKALVDLRRLWLDLRPHHVKRRWFPFGILHALWKPSIYDSTPLRNLLQKKIDPARVKSSGKRLHVGAVSLRSGEYHSFNEADPDLVSGVLASSSFPGVLEPVEVKGQWWTDGGVRDSTPLGAAMRMGATSVDVLVTTPNGVTSTRMAGSNTLKIGMRVLDVLQDEIQRNDIRVARMYNDMVQHGIAPPNKRYIPIEVIQPSSPLVKDPFDFSPMKVREMIDRGYQDARKWSSR